MRVDYKYYTRDGYIAVVEYVIDPGMCSALFCGYVIREAHREGEEYERQYFIWEKDGEINNPGSKKIGKDLPFFRVKLTHRAVAPSEYEKRNELWAKFTVPVYMNGVMRVDMDPMGIPSSTYFKTHAEAETARTESTVSIVPVNTRYIKGSNIVPVIYETGDRYFDHYDQEIREILDAC